MNINEPVAIGQYLTEAWLEEVGTHDFTMKSARKFLLEVLPEAVELMHPYTMVKTGDSKDALGKPVKEICIATGGWSGAEDLIAAILENPVLSYHHTRWERGGAYWFQV